MTAINSYSPETPKTDTQIRRQRIRAVDAALEIILARAAAGGPPASSYGYHVGPLADAIQAAIDNGPQQK